MLRPYNRGVERIGSVSAGRRYRARGVSVGRRDRARRSAPSLSCGIHSSSPLPCRQNSSPNRAPRQLPATPESGARNACAAAAKAAASPAPDTPREEIPPCPAASWSARDSPRAAARLHLPAARRIVPAAAVEESLSRDVPAVRLLKTDAAGNPIDQETRQDDTTPEKDHQDKIH